MVIETPEGLTLVEPTENSSFYFVQENEGQETPPGTIKWQLKLKIFSSNLVHGNLKVFDVSTGNQV